MSVPAYLLQRQRAAWIALLERAAEVGQAAADGDGIGLLDAQAFAGQVVRAPQFPLGWFSAQATAKGFLQLARGFVEVRQPEVREALGRAMAEAARCCRRMIDLDNEQHAAAWRRRTAED